MSLDPETVRAVFKDILKPENFMDEVRRMNGAFGTKDKLENHNLYRCFVERLARRFGLDPHDFRKD